MTFVAFFLGGMAYVLGGILLVKSATVQAPRLCQTPRLFILIKSADPPPFIPHPPYIPDLRVDTDTEPDSHNDTHTQR